MYAYVGQHIMNVGAQETKKYRILQIWSYRWWWATLPEAGNWTGVLCKTEVPSQLPRHLSRPLVKIIHSYICLELS